jgi:hypothetical protein
MSEQEQGQQQEQEQEQEQQQQQQQQKPTGTTFYKQKLAAIEQEKADLAKQLEAAQTAQLQEKENFKQLWENEKTKREAAEKKAQDLSTTVFNNFKTSAIKEEALKAGILDSAVDDLDMLDTSIVEVETTDKGNVNIHGADNFIEDLKARKPHWFKAAGAPIVNNGTPGHQPPKELTAAEIVDLEKTDPAKYKEIMNKRLARK